MNFLGTYVFEVGVCGQAAKSRFHRSSTHPSTQSLNKTMAASLPDEVVKPSSQLGEFITKKLGVLASRLKEGSKRENILSKLNDQNGNISNLLFHPRKPVHHLNGTSVNSTVKLYNYRLLY